MKTTATLTCISIEQDEYEPFVDTARGKLIRYSVKFAEGLEGEYWAQSEASKRHFPLNRPRTYEYEPLSKKGGKSTLKFSPCKQSAALPGNAPSPSPTLPLNREKAQRIADTTPLPSLLGDRELTFPALHATAEDIVALKSAILILNAGKIEFPQLEETATKLKHIIINISKK